MHYLLSVIDDHTGPDTEKEQTAVDAFNNDRLVAGGYWVFAGGLGSNESATTLDNRDGAGLVTDGPFVETKEHTAGIWIIEAPDLDVALRLAAEGSRACHRKVEVRPFL